tara:strand:+ start:3491 stop:3607 length:117 start_codon:yes stop_codon:yes gene_type:complete
MANRIETFKGFEGVLLQSTPKADGTSQNPHICTLQEAT